MPDLSALLSDTTEWRDLATLAGRGELPHAVLAVLPREFWPSLRTGYARIALCRTGTGDDGCEACTCWREEEHPDLSTAGEWGKTPRIEDCLDLQATFFLKPFAAWGRLVVFPDIDRVSPPAANAMLKTTEEPPEGGKLLFLAEREDLIPITIRSRVWTLRFRLDLSALEGATSAPPESSGEWASWLERTRKVSLEEIALEASAWARTLAGRGAWIPASELENLLFLAQQRRMAVSMVQDAIHAVLKEGVRSEEIFGDLREA